MNRLRDELALDTGSEQGLAMLRNVQPTASAPGLKRKVWLAIQQRPAAWTAARRRQVVLRASVVGVGVVALAATAAATLGGARVGSSLERLLSAPASLFRAHPPRVRPTHVAAAAPGWSASAPAPSTEPAVEPTDTRGRPTRHEPLPLIPARGAALREAHDTSETVQAARERTQVLDALVALRRDHDPARAMALLGPDLGTSRHGGLRQEALVVAIEASDATGDLRGAVGYARAYLQEFASGRFRQVAVSYLDRAGAEPQSSAPAR